MRLPPGICFVLVSSLLRIDAAWSEMTAILRDFFFISARPLLRALSRSKRKQHVHSSPTSHNIIFCCGVAFLAGGPRTGPPTDGHPQSADVTTGGNNKLMKD